MHDLLKYLETKASPVFIVIVLAWIGFVIVIIPILYQLNKRLHLRIFNRVYAYYGILSSGALIFLVSLYYLIWGYTKEFTLVVVDNSNHTINNFKLSVNGREVNYDKSNPTVKINSKQLYACVRVECKSLNKSEDINNNDFVDQNTIHVKLNSHSKDIPCNRSNKNLKIAFPSFANVDYRGIDLFTPSSSFSNYVYFKKPLEFKNESYEVAVNSLLYNVKSSLTLDIAGGVMILVGEGTLKHVAIKVNYSGKSDGWVEIKKYELEQAIKLNEPVRLSVTVTKLNDSNINLCTTIYHCNSIDEKMQFTEIRNITLNESNNFKIGCISNVKSQKPAIRLLNVHIVDNKS